MEFVGKTETYSIISNKFLPFIRQFYLRKNPHFVIIVNIEDNYINRMYIGETNAQDGNNFYTAKTRNN